MYVTSGSWNPSLGHMLNSGNFSFSVMITGDHHHQSSPPSSSSSPSPSCWFKAKAQHHQSWRQPQLLDHPTSAASRTFWLRIMIYNLYKFTLIQCLLTHRRTLFEIFTQPSTIIAVTIISVALCNVCQHHRHHHSRHHHHRCSLQCLSAALSVFAAA